MGHAPQDAIVVRCRPTSDDIGRRRTSAVCERALKYGLQPSHINELYIIANVGCDLPLRVHARTATYCRVYYVTVRSSGGCNYVGHVTGF